MPAHVPFDLLFSTIFQLTYDLSNETTSLDVDDTATSTNSSTEPGDAVDYQGPDGDEDDTYDEEEEDDYNGTEYDYLPEFNSTAASKLNTEFITATARGTDEEVGVQWNQTHANRTQMVVDEPQGGMGEVRKLLKALSIDDEMLLYLILGCCASLVVLIIIVAICIVVYRRRYPVRLGLGRKFDTFQNPIYEKTMVRVPMQVEEVEETAEVDEQTTTPLPVAIKAEMEDLSDSTVME